jgi:hypothetical protein
VPTVRAVQRKIESVEGFPVVILHPDGRNVRDDRMHLPSYPFRRAMSDRSTVRAWKEGRFRERYPGFDVDVVGRDGRRIHGGTLLGTVRDEHEPRR